MDNAIKISTATDSYTFVEFMDKYTAKAFVVKFNQTFSKHGITAAFTTVDVEESFPNLKNVRFGE